jgi:4-diphosphocytidyl-2-C-methyl-D-erythritol kinase
MFFIQSDAKLNISLRVTGKRSDGYHEIRSIFFRLPSLESLTITPQYGHNVRDRLVTSGEKVDGENILEKIMRRARQIAEIPPLHIDLVKNIPPGSGMGGGSGNGAALLSWLQCFTGKTMPMPGEFGSDVPFFCSAAKWALAGGRGEEIRTLARPPENPAVVVATPGWAVSTKNAFELLSVAGGGQFPLTAEEGEREICAVLGGLGEKRRIGLLPNDFLPRLMKVFPQYLDFFAAFEKSGASAWGLTGSGSSIFGLFYDRSGICALLREMAKWNGVRKIFYLE